MLDEFAFLLRLRLIIHQTHGSDYVKGIKANGQIFDRKQKFRIVQFTLTPIAINKKNANQNDFYCVMQKELNTGEKWRQAEALTATFFACFISIFITTFFYSFIFNLSFVFGSSFIHQSSNLRLRLDSLMSSTLRALKKRIFLICWVVKNSSLSFSFFFSFH